jgi:hypothetical protein
VRRLGVVAALTVLAAAGGCSTARPEAKLGLEYRDGSVIAVLWPCDEFAGVVVYPEPAGPDGATPSGGPPVWRAVTSVATGVEEIPLLGEAPRDYQVTGPPGMAFEPGLRYTVTAAKETTHRLSFTLAEAARIPEGEVLLAVSDTRTRLVSRLEFEADARAACGG